MTELKSIIFRWTLICILSCCLTSCFTGVESTPKITAKELKKQKVADKREAHILDNAQDMPPSKWNIGKKFYIADNRAARAAWRLDPFSASDKLEGRIVVITAIDTLPTLTENPEVTLLLQTEDSPLITLEFRTDMTSEAWEKAKSFHIPHLIDMDMIDAVSGILCGTNAYILQSRRYGINGVDTIGTRYQPVRIIKVEPANEATPLRVFFTDDEDHISSALMTIGDMTTSRRNFETIFALESPRHHYKHISDENWSLICRGKVKVGMTPEECRLALGSPDDLIKVPTTAGMAERWTYTNGIYLLFEDGLLSAYKL